MSGQCASHKHETHSRDYLAQDPHWQGFTQAAALPLLENLKLLIRRNIKG